MPSPDAISAAIDASTRVFHLALIACEQDRDQAVAACIGAIIELAEMGADRREVLERAANALAGVKAALERIPRTGKS